MKCMPCTTCRRVVQINCTGICLSCQRGFVDVDQEDIYNTVEPAHFGVLDLTFQKMEKENAAQKRIQSENDFKEHLSRGEIGEATKTGGSNRFKHCRKSKEK